MSWFDRLPAIVRHLIILGAPVVLGWVSSDVIPALQDRPGAGTAFAALLEAIVLVVTPLTRQYGVGRATDPKG